MEESQDKSKTAIKREFKAIQSFVRQLIHLPSSQLNKLPLSEYIRDEIIQAHSMSMGALKRQIGFISKRMIDEPVDEAIEKLAGLQRPMAQANAQFHQLEKWREQLIQGNENVLERLVSDHNADRQHLRQMIRNARRELEQNKTPKTARQIFQYLRSLTDNEYSKNPQNKS